MISINNITCYNKSSGIYNIGISTSNFELGYYVQTSLTGDENDWTTQIPLLNPIQISDINIGLSEPTTIYFRLAYAGCLEFVPIPE